MRSTRDHAIKYFDAVEQSDGSYINRYGSIRWYNKEGETHREEGPAIICNDGRIFWYLNNIFYTFADWLIKLNKTDEDKMILVLQYA